MREFEVYLPTTYNDGSAVAPSKIQAIKDRLAKAFGGYTQVSHRTEGVWQMGGVTFRDEVTLVRVLDQAGADFDMAEFKRFLERKLEQEAVLIVCREVSVV